MNKTEEILSDMKAEEYSAYAGVYQAYAWQQGWDGGIVKFRLPDEHFLVTVVKESFLDREGTTIPTFDMGQEGFNLQRFMAVVSDMDSEGCIHYWRYSQQDRDEFLELGCTEDDSMKGLLSDDEFQHASGFLDKEEVTP